MNILKKMIEKMNGSFKLYVFKYEWKHKNHHNHTDADNLFPIDKVSVGINTYGSLNVSYYGNTKEKLIIGNYCSISGGVKFLLGGEHHLE